MIQTTALAVVALSVLVLFGWAFQVGLFISLFPGFVAMKFNTAVALLLCGAALWFSQRKTVRTDRISQICAVFATAIGGVTLIEELGGWDFGIDQLIVTDRTNAPVPAHPGRMASNAALCFVFVGAAFEMLRLRRLQTVACLLLIPAGSLALLSLICYLYQAEQIFGLGAGTRMALHTAGAFLALCVGGFMAISEDRGSRGDVETSASSRFALRLLPAVILIPLILGSLRLEGERAGFYTAAFGVALYTVATIVALSLFVWWNARLLAHADSERRRAEEAHLEGEQRMRLIIDTAYDAFISMDAKGDIIDWNLQAEKTFGYSRQEAIRRSLAETIIPERFREMHRRGLQRFLETGEGPMVHKRIEVSAVHRSGHEFPAELTISPVRWAGGWIFNAFVHDITERTQRDALEAASKAKDQFIAVLSHELRTPLTPVLATIMHLDARPDLAPPVREAIAVIQRNVELEARLIDDLLDVTRISKGKLRIERQPVSLHSVIRDAMDICQSLISIKRVAVELDLAAQNSQVDGDPPRLLQVFWNLLQNAIKFTPSGGRVLVRTRARDERVQVEIADSGIGITAEALPRIFEPFEQGDPTINRRFGGLGLGLALSKAVVEAHGGTIEAGSAGLNHGTTMTVAFATIDADSAPVSRVTAPSDTATQQRPLRVLLVEDHEDTRQTMARLIARWGHTVETAGNVATALRMANSQPFDLLISDLGLPDASGTDLMRQLRQSSSMPGIAISGFGTEQDAARSLAAGFAAHVTKPVGTQRLKALIDQIATTVGRHSPALKERRCSDARSSGEPIDPAPSRAC